MSRTSGIEVALAAFAHDIRTSLTGILALGELLASSNLPERERRWALGIKSSAEHLANLTTLAIDGAKTRAGRLVLHEDVFVPRQLAEAVAASLAVRAEAKALRTEVVIAAELPERARGDSVRLRAAIENLIDNAVKFTERGSVRFEAAAARGARGTARLVFIVADSGIGLAPAEIRRLFRPFTQANTDIARRYGGAGLGLASVKRLAKVMGGDLTVASTKGRGSRFRLTVSVKVVAGAEQGETPRPSAAADTRGLAVLCVEDNPYGRVVLNTILTELGHRADFAASGEEAVAAVGRGYDVVLMDVTLPGVDGLEAARRIRALPGAEGCAPIIGISGRTEPGDEAAARAAGMDAYMRKPLSPGALAQIMRALTGKTER